MRFAWFYEAFGFDETTYDETKSNFTFSEVDNTLRSNHVDKDYQVGPFDCPTVERLRNDVDTLKASSKANLGKLIFENKVACVKALHNDPTNAEAVFQVASQFNCLEMVDPRVRPEDGIGRYAMDHTQGPACALCCPAATVFRNYFVEGGQANKQLNMLDEVERALENDDKGYWNMMNGYCMPKGMAELQKRLTEGETLAPKLVGLLKVGVHWATEVGNKDYRVCQVFCSALPIAYARSTPLEEWEPFARIVLEGAYEATLLAAWKLALEKGRRLSVYLTALGGGAFGNPQEWIADCIKKVLVKYPEAPLDIYLVHYNGPPPTVYTQLE